MSVQVRQDSQRGCGWRKPGGLYLVSAGVSAPCGLLPISLDRCPCCDQGIKPSRGWTWIDAGLLLKDRRCIPFETETCLERCPLKTLTGRQGLIWIGEQFYPTPKAWLKEVESQGVSRRISALPKGFELGETWVLVAHRKVISSRCVAHPMGFVSEREAEVAATCNLCQGTGMIYTPAIFHAFKPSAVEYVVKGDETEDTLADLEKRGITPVKVERVEPQTELETVEATV